MNDQPRMVKLCDLWQRESAKTVACLALFGGGVVVGGLGAQGQAQTEPPTEHKGVSVTTLGVLPEDSVKKQVGLDG